LNKTILIIGSTVIIACLAWYFLSVQQDTNLSSQEITRLERMGDECVAISEKAIIGMTPVVEFQKLELLSRKANVLKNCMADRGFHEDAAWRKYAEPLANVNASKQAISFDEAIENIRKVDMWIFKKQDKRQLYWVSAKK
jgi:hypothetical protein